MYTANESGLSVAHVAELTGKSHSTKLLANEMLWLTTAIYCIVVVARLSPLTPSALVSDPFLMLIFCILLCTCTLYSISLPSPFIYVRVLM